MFWTVGISFHSIKIAMEWCVCSFIQLQGREKEKEEEKKGKKGDKYTDESDMELPLPSVLISDPGGIKPEKGILKSGFGKMRFVFMLINSSIQ